MTDGESEFISDKELDAIIKHVHEVYSVDFTSYARSSLSRRVARIKKMHQIADADAMTGFLNSDPAAIRSFVHEITVNTTEMFRDPETWLCLRNDVLPMLRDYDTIRIWHAGCSTGEEVYSMLILLHETGLLNKVKVYATDINEDALALTREGRFRKKLYDHYSSNYIYAGGKMPFSDYFEEDESFFCAKDFLKQPLNFKVHNMGYHDRFSKFDLILCRNVMIYFNTALQSKAVGLFAASLFKGSFLCIGKKESLQFLKEADVFKTFNQSERIFRLRG